MGRLRRPRAAADGVAFRKGSRFRHLVAAGLGVWLVAGLVPLAWKLPPALRAGSAAERLHAELSPLGSGWTGTIEVSEASNRIGPLAWEWSRGPISTITVKPSWSTISLELASVACPHGRRQHVFVSGPGAARARSLVIRPGYHWYPMPLGWLHGADELVLSYRCVQRPSPLDGGLRDRRPLAIAIAGFVVDSRG